MSFKDCIDTAVNAGDMDAARAARARGLYDEIEAEYRGGLGPSEGARRAARDTVEILKREAIETRRRNLLQAKAWGRIERNLLDYRRLDGDDDLASALVALLENDGVAAREMAKAVTAFTQRLEHEKSAVDENAE